MTVWILIASPAPGMVDQPRAPRTRGVAYRDRVQGLISRPRRGGASPLLGSSLRTSGAPAALESP